MTDSQKKRAARKAAHTPHDTDNARAWRDRMGQHNFDIRPRPVQDADLSSRNGGPQFKTQQWERTNR